VEYDSRYSTMPDSSFDNELILLNEIAKGSKKAFEVIYERYYIGIFYFARRFVREEKVAEDITLEAFLKLWERFSQFTSFQGIQAFLHTTAKNACLNHLRSQVRMSAHQRELAYLLAQGADDTLAEQQVTARIYQYIYNEIEKLPPQVRRVFKMSYIDGLSNQAIAEGLKINNQSVRNHKANALKHLRMTLLEKDLYGIFTLLCLLLLNYFPPL
jgi:RNA polymerase sigma-70 factor (family 1)